jgi:spore germination cell wall hydrolase CwlJ-like protein
MIKRGLIYIVIAGVIYILFMQDRRIEQMEDRIFEIHDDVEIIKEAVLERHVGQIKYTPQEFECLVRNIYYEAGVENDLGKYAVAQVTLNRKKLGYWGKNICNVVYSKAQFSWTKVKSRAWAKPKDATWKRSREIASQVLNNGVRVRPLKQALFYHADYVKPNWRDKDKQVAKIGQHIFYTQAKGSTLKL